MIIFTKNLNKKIPGGGGGATRVSDFFTKSPNLKNKKYLFCCFFFGEGVGKGARVSELICFY